jgi:hypothetical protein
VGPLSAAWPTATVAVRNRLLGEPQLFLKPQREHAVDTSSPATVKLDTPQCAEMHSRIHRALDDLGRLADKILHQRGAEDFESRRF